MRIQFGEAIEMNKGVEELPGVDNFVVRIIPPRASKPVTKEDLLVPKGKDDPFGLIKGHKPLVECDTNVV